MYECEEDRDQKAEQQRSHKAPAPTTSALQLALAQIANTPNNRKLVAFSRPKAALAANGGSRTGHHYVNAIDMGDDLGAIPPRCCRS